MLHGVAFFLIIVFLVFLIKICFHGTQWMRDIHYHLSKLITHPTRDDSTPDRSRPLTRYESRFNKSALNATPVPQSSDFSGQLTPYAPSAYTKAASAKLKNDTYHSPSDPNYMADVIDQRRAQYQRPAASARSRPPPMRGNPRQYWSAHAPSSRDRLISSGARSAVAPAVVPLREKKKSTLPDLPAPTAAPVAGRTTTPATTTIGSTTTQSGAPGFAMPKPPKSQTTPAAGTAATTTPTVPATAPKFSLAGSTGTPTFSLPKPAASAGAPSFSPGAAKVPSFNIPPQSGGKGFSLGAGGASSFPKFGAK
jgi:hypothetical protein